MPSIRLQPKQYDLLSSIYKSKARVLGAGGGRGSAKSGGLDRIALTLMAEQPGIALCIVMRTYEQLRKYHIDPILRGFPELHDYYYKTDKKLVLPCGGGKFSQLDLGYAENYDAVEEFFRSANYKYIMVDQAEQFLEEELREMRKACRWPTGGSKVVLSHNMGGAGFQTLRNWFHVKQYKGNETSENYHFIKFDPWDNVEWVKMALAEDGLSERDYYSWSDKQRMEYAAERGEYTKELANDDEALRNRDWIGSWDCVEGAYFGRVFDLKSTRITPQLAEAMRKSWATGWMSQDWGKTHYCVTYWHYRITLSPSEVAAALGWEVQQPLNVVVTYREKVLNEKTSTEVGQEIVQATPKHERDWLKAFFLSPECCLEKNWQNSIGGQLSKELKPYGMPGPTKADNDRIGGYTLMHKLLNETRLHGASRTNVENIVWLISSECPELLNSIPILMRDPKNLDDVLKTDRGSTRIEQDCSESARYGLKTMLAPRSVPKEELDRRKIAAAPDEFSRRLVQFKVTKERDALLARESERRPAHWDN